MDTPYIGKKDGGSCPRCPNHAVPLQLTADPGMGICPISGAYFTYKANEDKGKVKKDKYGRVVTEYTIKQIGGKGG